MESKRRIGIFGGSFDPVHLGHLWIAEAARETLSLEQVGWIPAATSPLKPGGAIESDQARIQMLRLAISGHPHFHLDDREICRGEISYTVDTIREIRDEEPDAELFLIMGSDSLASLDRWHQPAELLELVTLAIVERGGDAAIDFSVLESLTSPERIDACRSSVIAMPLIEVSSTDLRHRIETSQSIRYQVPAAVESLIHNDGLYRNERSRQG